MSKLGYIFAAVAAVFVLAVVALDKEQLLPVGQWLVYLATPAANGFVLIYGLTRPWYRTPIGRALMTKAVGVAILFDMSALSNAFGLQVPIDVQVLVVGLLVVGIWFQFLVMLTTPRDRGPGDRG